MIHLPPLFLLFTLLFLSPRLSPLLPFLFNRPSLYFSSVFSFFLIHFTFVPPGPTFPVIHLPLVSRFFRPFFPASLLSSSPSRLFTFWLPLLMLPLFSFLSQFSPCFTSGSSPRGLFPDPPFLASLSGLYSWPLASLAVFDALFHHW